MPFLAIPAGITGLAAIGVFTATGGLSGGIGYIADFFMTPDAQWSWGDFGTSVGLGGITAGASRAIGPAVAKWFPQKSGPYENIKNPRNTGIGKNFTQTQKKNILQENFRQNNGKLVSDDKNDPYRFLKKAQQSKTGVTPPKNETQIDHIIAKTRGEPMIVQMPRLYLGSGTRYCLIIR